LASRLNSALSRSGKKGGKSEINPAAIKEKLDRIKAERQEALAQAFVT